MGQALVTRAEYAQLFEIEKSDYAYLREVAKKVRECANRPFELQKAEKWRAHNDLETYEPLIFISPENGWNEIITPDQLRCQTESARAIEFELLTRVYHAEHLKDDFQVDAYFNAPYLFTTSGWGVDIQHVGGGEGKSYIVKPAVEDYERDFKRLRFPEIELNMEASDRYLELMEEIFGGILTVRRRMQWWWSLGLTAQFIDLRGFENFLVDLIDEPEWVHRMMGFLTDGMINRIEMLARDGLLSQNNENDYVGSGGFGFTNDLPLVTDRPVTPKDMWGFVESQETVSVSPDMYAEYFLPYHKRLAEMFGLNCFGCCEPYDGRWKYAKQLNKLRRVSCSPWSSRDIMKETLGKNYIASIKPNPAPLAVPRMDEAQVRAELKDALKDAKELVAEVVMKDCHTLGKNPQNAVRWVEIAREEAERAML